MATPPSSRAASHASPPLGDHRLRCARWMVLFWLAAAAGCAYLTRHGLAVANTTIQKELGCSNEHFGYLYGAFSLGYLLCQLPGGWLGQRIGTRITLSFAAALWSVMTLATAYATNLAALIGIRFLFGVAQAVLVPNQAKVLQDWIPASMRGTASSVVMVSMSLGSIASLWLTSTLMDSLSWRTIFTLYSGVGLLWGLLFFWWFRTTPYEMPWLGLSHVTDDIPAQAAPTLPATMPRVRFGAFVGSLSLWGLAGMALFKAAGYNLLVTFLPAMLEYSYHLTPEQAGQRTSWCLVTHILGTILSGVLTDGVQRVTGSRFWSRSGVGTVSLGLAAIWMCAAGFAATATGLVTMLCAAAFFAGICSAPTWAAAIDLGGRNTALVMGWVNTASATAGIAFSPAVGKLVDAIRDGWGDWSLLIWLHAMCYLFAAACWLVVFPDRPLHLSEDGDVI